MKSVVRVVCTTMAALLCASAVAHAQEWAEFVNIADGFRVDFPGQPRVQQATWTSEYGYTLPARVYMRSRRT